MPPKGWTHPPASRAAMAAAWEKRRAALPDFWSFVDASGDCWEWTGSLGSEGYGNWHIRGPKHRPANAHRHAYLELVGPVPEGMHLDHLCRNRACVNPDHMEVVSRRINILRGVSPFALNARKTHCKNGHEFTPENTQLDAKGRSCRTCRRAIFARWYDKHRRKAA